MSLRLTPASIATAALRRIGQLPPSESAASGSDLSIALGTLDRILSYVGGVEQLEWLKSSAVQIAIEDGQQRYDLNASISPDLDYVSAARLVFDGADSEPLELLLRDDWDALTDRDRQSGRPMALFIERTPDAVGWLYPIPDDDFTLELTRQRVTPDVTQSNGTVDHAFFDSWQLFLEWELAYQLGTGPIRSLPPDQRREMRSEAMRLKNELMAKQSRQNVHRPRFTRAYGI